MTCFLGVDVGGTTTHARLIDGGSARDVVQPSRSWLGQDRAGWLAAAAAVAEAVAVSPQAICVGASGCEAPADAVLMAETLHDVWPTAWIRVVNDAELVLPAAGVDAGVALVAGTGSIAISVDQHGRTWRAGGWGHALGDDGSAYALVREAARRVLGDQDRGAGNGLLSMTLYDALDVSSSAELLRSLHADIDPAAWAALAPRVCQVAEAGDPQALSVVERCAQELVALVDTVAERSSIDNPVVLAGGLLLNQRVVAGRVTELLCERQFARQVHTLTSPPVAGAVALARKLANDRGD